MIKLFNPKENNFNSAGIATLMPIKLIETKKISLNGWFIDVELPMKYKDLVEQDMLAVIKSKSKLQAQAFRIKNIEYTKRKIKFQAEHVMFDARDYYLVDVRPTKINAHTALNYVNDRTDKRSPFTFSSNVNNTSTAYFLDKTLLEAMETIEDRWGGFFDANNWHIELKKSIGIDRGEVISYGKNLEDIKVHEDWSNVVTRIYPVGFDGVRLPEVYIDADVQYPTPYTKRIDFETEYEDDDRTEENLIPELRENALEYLEKNKYPRVNYEIKSDINQRMEIGDTVHVKHPLVDLMTEVQEYEYNVLTKRVVKLVFGNYTRDVKQKFDKIKEDIDRVITQTSKQEAITQHQTDLINNLNKNGHVYIDDNQILILDKLPKENAKYVWRWNMGGLAFSENGVEGPFKQAWTIDGIFNTDFISAGSIMTNHLSSDVGASLDLSSNTSINMLVENVEKGLDDKITQTNKDIKEQSGRLDVAYDKIESNVVETGKVKDRINNAEKQLTTHEGKITTTAREVTALSNTVDRQGKQLASAEIKLDGVAGNVTINANNIRNKLDKGKAAQDINTGTVAINADKIKLEGYTTINGNFAVDWWGNMSARNATISGSLIAEIGGDKMAELKNSGLTIFNRDGSGRKIGILEAVRDVGTSNSGVSLSHEDDSYLAVSYWDKSRNSYIRYMSFDKYNIIQDSKYNNYPVHFGHNTYFGGNIEASRVISRSDYSLDFGSVGRRKLFTKLTNNEVRLNVYEMFPRAGHGGLIGLSSNRYEIIYLKNQPNVSSDLRQKENIRNLPDKLLEMLMDIQPKMYDQDGKIHFGYIAQDIERSLYKYAVSEVGWEHAKEFIKDFAFLHKDESYLSLLYGEIAVLKDAQFRKRINELEYKIEKLEEQFHE